MPIYNNPNNLPCTQELTKPDHHLRIIGSSDYHKIEDIELAIQSWSDNYVCRFFKSANSTVTGEELTTQGP